VVSFQGTKEAIEHFEEYCREGRLVDDGGVVHAPWFMVDWAIYVDGEKAAKPVRIPADNREHLIDLYGPAGYGHMWQTVKVAPRLRIVPQRA
jgi:hypothetical protein